MPQISSNNLNRASLVRETSTSVKTASVLLSLANQLEDEICRALLNDDVALAERLVVPKTQLMKLSREFSSSKSVSLQKNRHPRGSH